MNTKTKFKVGDIVRVAKFPMGMFGGSGSYPEELYDSREGLTITNIRMVRPIFPGHEVPGCIVKENSWYFDLDSLELVKKSKQIRSWILK